MSNQKTCLDILLYAKERKYIILDYAYLSQVSTKINGIIYTPPAQEGIIIHNAFNRFLITRHMCDNSFGLFLVPSKDTIASVQQYVKTEQGWEGVVPLSDCLSFRDVTRFLWYTANRIK